MKNISYENKLILSFIDFVLFIVKWLSLCMSVIVAALTIGLFIMNLIENSSIPTNFFISMVSAITSYSFNDASVLINRIGKMNALVGTIGLGITVTVNYILLYMISNRFRMVFKNFSLGKYYTRENLKIIESTIPITLLFAFALPVIKFFLVISVGMLDFADISIAGIFLLFIAMIIKMLIENGYVLVTNLERKKLELSDMKAKDTVEKINLIKQENKEIKSKKKKVKKTNTNKTTTTKSK